MIYKCIALFNLLPTSQPHYWLIAADWLEEENLDITAVAFREGFFTLENNNINHFKFPTLSKCVFGVVVVDVEKAVSIFMAVSIMALAMVEIAALALAMDVVLVVVITMAKQLM